MTLNHHQSNDSVASKRNNDVENLFKDQTYPGKCYKAEAWWQIREVGRINSVKSWQWEWLLRRPEFWGKQNSYHNLYFGLALSIVVVFLQWFSGQQKSLIRQIFQSNCFRCESVFMEPSFFVVDKCLLRNVSPIKLDYWAKCLLLHSAVAGRCVKEINR